MLLSIDIIIDDYITLNIGLYKQIILDLYAEALYDL